MDKSQAVGLLFTCVMISVQTAFTLEGNMTFFCKQFFVDIKRKSGFEFTIYDSSEPGTILKQFEPPIVYEDRVHLTSDDGHYIGFKNYALVVQRSLRPRNGHTLTLSGVCLGLIEDYNFTAPFQFTYVVTVIDKNDPPVFVNLPATIELYENATIGSVVYRVKTNDSMDLDPSYWTNYLSIEKVTGLDTSRPSPTRTFQITDTGHIRLVENLDYERGPRTYKIMIGARDAGTPPARSYSKLVVRVLDVDDMPPKFTNDIYTTRVIGEKPLLGKEECFNTTPRVLAEDLDRQLKSEIRYDIIEGEPGIRDYWGEYFRIEPSTGMLCQLQMVQRLLRDAMTGRDVFFNFTFTVRATQKDNPQKYDTSHIFVEIIDDNQYAPAFDRKLYRTSLPEYPVTNDGTEVVQVKAIDKDFGLNNEFIYSLLTNPGGAFTVDPHTGDIIVAQSYLLDRETQEYIELRVQAKETRTIDQYDDVTRVLVHVLDVNDNSPLFTNATYRYTIKDTLQQGRHIHLYDERPHAFDGDAGENGRVSYRIKRVHRLGGAAYTPMVDMGRFSVDPDSGVISLAGSLRDLRRKRTYPVFKLEVTAEDKAPVQTDRLSSSADVYITLLHANDHAPTFSPPPSIDRMTNQNTAGRYHVTENAPIGTMIAKLQAADDDGDEDVFLKYWISAGDEHGIFFVTNDGRLILKQSLDRESDSLHKLIVSVSDGQHNVSTNVGVFVTDENDNKPRFEREEYVFTIPEESSAGIVVGQTLATDADLGEAGQVTYSIKPGPATDVFTVKKGGIIVVDHEGPMLDREQVKTIQLKVIATDRGTPPLRSTVDVTVHLDDINDNAPSFSHQLYFGSVYEDNLDPTPRKVVLERVINATDADSTSQNRDVIYNIRGDGSDVFHIDPRDAHIAVSRYGRLDAETKQEYHMELIATDRNNTGMSTHAEIIIKVKDINDNSPYFHGDVNFTISNDIPIGSVVGHVTALDNDVTEVNNRVIYVLRKGGFGKFAVDFESGAITVEDAIDREPYRKNYQLRIDALDSGLPRRMNTAVITVSAPGKRRPIIDKSSTNMAVYENMPEGTAIGKVEGRDPDDPENSNGLRYHIDTSSTAPFRIREDTGHVFTTSSLDYETQREHSFTVYVSDASQPELKSNATVTVKISDVNDRPPVFQLSRYEGSVREDDRAPDAGQMVTMPVNITTIEMDGSRSSRRSRLSIHGEHSDYFYVDTDSNVVRVSSMGAGNIDRETRDRFQLVLRATDDNDPKLYTEVDYVIHISDFNDNAPLFLAPPHEILVHETVQVGEVIGRLLADDADATSPNNDVMYILESDPFGKFRLDLTTGAITVLSGLYFQPRQQTYDLSVTAIDLGTPRRTAQTTVTVRVLKKHFNDGKPEFLGDTIFHTPEEVPMGTVVGTLRFSSEELSPGESVNLRIVSKTRVPFAINSGTGDVRTTSRLDSDAGPRVYAFAVMATDSSNPQNTAKTTVGVIIEDINDHPPRFTQYEYRHRVADTFPPGTIVATPFAYDDVDIEQSKYIYSLKGEGSGKIFVIDPKSGIVKTTDALADVDRDTMEFALVAEDIRQRSLVALARLVIDVTRSGKPGPCVPESVGISASGEEQ